MADARTLNVVNYFDHAIDVAVTSDNWNCCDQPVRGQTIGNIPSNGMKSFVYCRTDGHGCNGRQGQFQLAIESSNLVDLNFDANGSIQLSGKPGGFNAFISSEPDGNFSLIVGEPT